LNTLLILSGFSLSESPLTCYSYTFFFSNTYLSFPRTHKFNLLSSSIWTRSRREWPPSAWRLTRLRLRRRSLRARSRRWNRRTWRRNRRSHPSTTATSFLRVRWRSWKPLSRRPRMLPTRAPSTTLRTKPFRDACSSWKRSSRMPTRIPGRQLRSSAKPMLKPATTSAKCRPLSRLVMSGKASMRKWRRSTLSCRRISTTWRFL
ncbi:hypothetical protein ANOM_004849, partial [Aspergillus nomiae NRRL 13137]